MDFCDLLSFYPVLQIQAAYLANKEIQNKVGL